MSNNNSSDKAKAAESKTPAKAPAAKGAQAKAGEQKPAKKGSGSLGALAALALIIAIGVGIYAFTLQQQLKQGLEQQSASVTSLKGELATSNAAIATMDETLLTQADLLAGTNEKLQANTDYLVDSMQALADLVGKERSEWIVTEAEYLVLVAGHRLVLERDVYTAIAALEAADQRLRDIGDPGVMPIRQSISDAVHALKAFGEPDVAGMAMRLGSMIEGIDALPVLYTDISSKKKVEEIGEEVAHDAESLSEAGDKFIKEIKNIVAFRVKQERAVPLLPMEQKYFLQQNLQLKLETARTALMYRMSDIYHQSLSEAAEWIKAHFDEDAPAARTMLDEIKKLNATNIKPSLPDISQPLKEIRAYLPKEKALRVDREIQIPIDLQKTSNTEDTSVVETPQAEQAKATTAAPETTETASKAETSVEATGSEDAAASAEQATEQTATEAPQGAE